MIRFRPVLVLVLLLAAARLSAQATDPREQSYQFFVDGVLTAGVIGTRSPSTTARCLAPTRGNSTLPTPPTSGSSRSR